MENKKELYVVKIYREPHDSNGICRLYCWSKDQIKLEEKVKEVLIANHDFKKLNLNPDLFYVSTIPVEEENVEIINKFCVTCEW